MDEVLTNLLDAAIAVSGRTKIERSKRRLHHTSGVGALHVAE